MDIPFIFRSPAAILLKPATQRRTFSELLTVKRTKPGKKYVYISYCRKSDYGFKKFLEHWADDSGFVFIFNNFNPAVAPESPEGRRIKAAAIKQMRHARYFLILVGAHAHEDPWVSWEIEQAMHPAINLKFAAVKLHHDCIAPEKLNGQPTSWSSAFTRQSILSALAEAQ
jgi:hypothetical protein